jgi:hypothetical protein
MLNFPRGSPVSEPAQESCMTVINGARLTNFAVSPDGSMISINVIDENSEPGSLVLPSESLQSLIMSMPEMMQQALRRRYQDPSLKLVYPLGKWSLETSTEPGKLILTLSTPDGFAVSFAVTAAELKQFASATRRARHARVPPRN